MIDPTFDPRLADRLHVYAQGGVRRIDSLAIAEATITHSRRRRMGRAGLTLLAAALLVSGAGAWLASAGHPNAPTPGCGASQIVTKAPADPRDRTYALDLAALDGRATYVRWMHSNDHGKTWSATWKSDPVQGDEPSEAARVDIWTTDPDGVARPVTTVEGRTGITGRIADVSLDGSFAAVIAGQIGGPDILGECADAYRVPLDGGQPERLTTSGPGDLVSVALARSDGTVALVRHTPDSTAIPVSSHIVMQVAMGGASTRPWQTIDCGWNGGHWAAAARTRNGPDRLAVGCPGRVLLVDLANWTTRVLPVDGEAEALLWTGTDTLRIASISDSGLHIRTVELASSSGTVWSDTADKIDWYAGGPYMAFSPDGRWLTAQGETPANGNVYVLPGNGGPMTPILSSDQESGWGLDGTLLYLESDRSSLWRLHPSTGERTNVADDPVASPVGVSVPVVRPWR